MKRQIYNKLREVFGIFSVLPGLKARRALSPGSGALSVSASGRSAFAGVALSLGAFACLKRFSRSFPSRPLRTVIISR